MSTTFFNAETQRTRRYAEGKLAENQLAILSLRSSAPLR
jgi:hypothetical protein